jgi:hypothetical protein
MMTDLGTSPYAMTQALKDPDAAASAIRAGGQARIAAIEANKDLSLIGRIAQTEAVRSDVNARLAALAESVKAAEAARVDALRQRIFVPPTPLGATASDKIASAASMRDALDRASRTSQTTEELDGMLARAITVADSIQARACLVIALERFDADVVNAYTAANPTEHDTVEQYWTASQAQSIHARVMDAFRFSGI